MFLNKSLNLRSLVIRLTVTLVLIGWVGSTGAVSSTPEIPPLASIGAAQAVPRPLSDLPIGMMVHPPSLDYFNDVARSDDIGAVLVVSTGLLPRITLGKRLVMSPSVDLAEENAAAFVDDAEYLGYNVEHWPDTPDAEQADPATASANAAEFADRHDLGYVIGPDLQFTEDFGAELAQPADIYVIQGQRIQEDVAFFATTVNAFARNVRSGNPDVKVWVQVSSSFGTPEATIEALKEVAGQIDGIWVHYNQNAQSFATLQDLMRLLRPAAQTNTPGATPVTTPAPSPTIPEAVALTAATATPTTSPVVARSTATVPPVSTPLPATPPELPTQSPAAPWLPLVGAGMFALAAGLAAVGFIAGYFWRSRR